MYLPHSSMAAAGVGMRRFQAAVPLGAKPKPMAHAIVDVQMVTLYRLIGCLQYDRCVEYAAANHWKGWRCNECRLYVYIPDVEGIFDGDGVDDGLDDVG